MNDAELAQDLRDEADRLERDMDEYCTQAGAVDIMRRAAARIEATAGVVEALEMVRDADNDCHCDGLRTIPSVARAAIDAAIAKYKGASNE